MLNLYSVTLQKPTAITCAVFGSFSSPKALELIVAKGKILELIKPDEQSMKLQVVLSQEMFGIIRSMATFRLTQGNREYIILGSDSGRVVILQYDGEKNAFIKIHQETYGKTGVRRIVPGEYLATDPKGRAFMIGALEKQKFVYILNRDNQGKLTISSPLEAHKSRTLIYHICGVDVGYENPLFACLEADYGEVDQKTSTYFTGTIEKYLTFYEMDLGLNHVVRKNTEEVHSTAHLLIPVFGLPDGPSGVIICCSTFVVYKNLAGSEKILPLPFRAIASGQGVVINSFAMHKQKDQSFYLLQTELGDLFKLSFQFSGDEVHNISLLYFDTITPACSICIFKTGQLFAASEYGNHKFYNFLSIGDETEKDSIITNVNTPLDTPVVFQERALKNLKLLDELQNLSGISDMHIEDLTGEGSKAFSLNICQLVFRSISKYYYLFFLHFILLRFIYVVQHMNTPHSGFFAMESQQSRWQSNKYQENPCQFGLLKKILIVPFISILFYLLCHQHWFIIYVLSIGQKVVEVNDSGLIQNKGTLYINILEDNAIIQVTDNGIRHIRRDKKINQWEIDGKITKAASNERQLVIALQGGELIYFELDSLGQLSEVEKITLESEVLALDIGPIPPERQRCKFMAVALSDNSACIFSLDQETCLQKLSTLGLPKAAESVCLMEMAPEKTQEEETQQSQLILHVGLQHGVLLRAVVDQVTGNLTDRRSRFLGTKPVRLHKVTVSGHQALMALSSRSWLCYTYFWKQMMVPLCYQALDACASFNSQECKSGIVALSQNQLVIFTLEKLGETFNQSIVPLTYSPRKMIVHPETHNIIIIEADCVNKYAQGLPTKEWKSLLRIIEPIEKETIETLEFSSNESAVSVELISFTVIKPAAPTTTTNQTAGQQLNTNQPASEPTIQEQQYLVIGTVKGLTFNPKSFQQCFLYVYSFAEKGHKLELFHKTEVEDIPYCLATLKGKLAAGIGSMIKIYELGKKQLLKKYEYRGLSGGINKIQVIGTRVFASDLSDSFHIFRYNTRDQALFEFADDVLPRWTTSICVLDYHTIAAADKFENFYVCRLPENIDDQLDQDPLAYKFKWESGYLNGAPYKLTQICNFYVGEVITTLQKTTLVNNLSEVIVYGTSMGSIGVFYPFETKEDIDFFVHLEMYLRIEAQPLCGRDHLMFRSFYGPIKNIIDGDLCEEFAKLGAQKQKVLSDELDRTPAEVLKKLEDIKNRII